MLEVMPIPYEDKPLLQQLVQFYRYDSSEFDGHALTQHGVYQYKYLDHQWTEEFRRPLLFKVDDEIAGFALVILDIPKEFAKLSDANETNLISDFFIMRKFRRNGYGMQAAHLIFDRFPGNWELRQTSNNTTANRFWNDVINKYTGGDYREVVMNGDEWRGPVQVFDTRK